MYYNKGSFSMYYEKYGKQGDCIVILPGWGETRPSFCHMIQELSKNYLVYIIDYPGFGLSVFPDVPLSIYDYTNLVRDFMESEHITNPILIGHSFGGRIATLITGYYQDPVSKLILIDAAGIKPRKGIYKRGKQWIYKLFKKLSFLVPRRKRNIYLRKLVSIFGSKDSKKLDQNMYLSFIKIVNEDLKHFYSSISCSTLLIWGSKDRDTPLKDGKYMRKKIRDSRIIIYPKVGHFSYLECAELTSTIIKEFIENKKRAEE